MNRPHFSLKLFKIKMPKQKIAFILSLAISLFHFAGAWGEAQKPQTLFVSVYQVVDARFPALDEKEIQKIFAEAKVLLKDKFGVNGMFEYKGEMTREQYNENFWYPRKPPQFVQNTVDGKKVWRIIIQDIDKEKEKIPDIIQKENLGNAFVDVWGLFGEQNITFENYKDAIINNIKMKWQVDELSQFLDHNKTSQNNFFEAVAESLFNKYNAWHKTLKHAA